MREEGKLCPLSALFFSPGPASNNYCKNKEKYNLSETTQTPGGAGKKLKHRESQMKFNLFSSTLMGTWA